MVPRGREISVPFNQCAYLDVSFIRWPVGVLQESVIWESETINEHQQNEFLPHYSSSATSIILHPLPCFTDLFPAPHSQQYGRRNSPRFKCCLNQGLLKLWKWSLKINTTAILSLASTWSDLKTTPAPLVRSQKMIMTSVITRLDDPTPNVSSQETSGKKLLQVPILGH